MEFPAIANLKLGSTAASTGTASGGSGSTYSGDATYFTVRFSLSATRGNESDTRYLFCSKEAKRARVEPFMKIWIKLSRSIQPSTGAVATVGNLSPSHDLLLGQLLLRLLQMNVLHVTASIAWI